MRIYSAATAFRINGSCREELKKSDEMEELSDWFALVLEIIAIGCFKFRFHLTSCDWLNAIFIYLFFYAFYPNMMFIVCTFMLICKSYCFLKLI